LIRTTCLTKAGIATPKKLRFLCAHAAGVNSKNEWPLAVKEK